MDFVMVAFVMCLSCVHGGSCVSCFLSRDGLQFCHVPGRNWSFSLTAMLKA